MSATAKQLRTLMLIDLWTRQHGAPPTIREMAGAESVSPHAIECRVEALARKGLLRRGVRMARAFALTAEGTGLLPWPVAVLGEPHVCEGGTFFPIETRFAQ